jgi:hypothetical protein
MRGSPVSGLLALVSTRAKFGRRSFNYFGGVTAMIVSDNLKSGIIKDCFYEPNVNRTYEEMAKH